YMRTKVVRSLIGLTLISVIAAGLAVSRGLRQGTATSPNSGQDKPKKLREIAMERDVEVPGLEENSEYFEYSDLKEMAKDAKAIVYGKIIETSFYFDDSGLPFEHGRIIMTQYTVEVLRVLKDRTGEIALPPDKAPAPLATPLKIKRSGGVVYVNGHRASMKEKGSEAMNTGNEYVFFLFWGSAYKTYSLAGNISGVVVVNYDSSLQSLASSEKMRSEFSSMRLEDL